MLSVKVVKYGNMIAFRIIYKNSIAEDKRMLSKSKSSKGVVKSTDVSLQHLATLNSFLDGQLSQTQYIAKEINNQIALSHKNEGIVNRTIYKINGHGQSLANRYEEEKERNQKLQFLVKHIENEILNAKVEKANDLKNKVQTDKLVELTNFLSDREKELEKICEKTNTASYQLSKKMDGIRALRSERAIFSSLFDKLERELCNLEHCYKVLVIEHKIEDKECEQGIQQFNKCQVSGIKKLDKVMTRSQITRGEELIEIHDKTQEGKKARLQASGGAVQSNKAANYRESEFVRQKEQKERQKGRSTKFQNDLYKINRQRKVKLIFNELGISSIKDIPEDLQQLDQINERLLEQNEKVYEEISKTEARLIGLVRKQKLSGGSTKREELASKKWLITKFVQEHRKNRLELTQFRQICRIVLQSIRQNQQKEKIQQKESERHQFLNQEEEIVYYMSQIQKYLQKSYVDNIDCLSRPKRQKIESNRLSSLLMTNHTDKNIMSIYEEKYLLQFAKKNLSKPEVKPDRRQSVKKRGD